jgi:hypothetical protein
LYARDFCQPTRKAFIPTFDILDGHQHLHLQLYDQF